MRKNDPEGVRARILDAAAELFQDQGYSASGMQAIFSRAAVTSGAFYHHFEGKKDLGLAVVKERVATAVQETWIAPVKSARNTIDGLKTVMTAIASDLDASRMVRGCPLNNLALEMAFADQDFREALHEVFLSWQGELERALKRDMKAGLIRRASVTSMATFIIAVYSGAMAMSKVQQSSAPLRASVVQLIDALRPR